MRSFHICTVTAVVAADFIGLGALASRLGRPWRVTNIGLRGWPIERIGNSAKAQAIGSLERPRPEPKRS